MKKIKAFTLIETLIVIIVFCIGILTVLYGMSQTLRNQNYAKTQIQSAFFAREWIELVFNLRDANYHKEIAWNCIPQGWFDDSWWCKKNLSPDNVLKLDIGDDDNYINVGVENTFELTDENFDEIFEKYQIYKHINHDDNTFVYNHVECEDEEESEWCEATWFARYIVIKTVEWVNSDDNLLKIESHVLYRRWGLQWEKVMETFIGNYEFEDYWTF